MRRSVKSVKRKVRYVPLGLLVLMFSTFNFSLVQAENELAEEFELASASMSSVEIDSPVISMDFQEADLQDVLKLFSQQAGLNFIAESASVREQKVTLYLDSVTVNDALETLMAANNLTYERKENSGIFVVKKIIGSEILTITKVFQLQYTRLFGYELAQTAAEGKRKTSATETDIVSILENIVTEDYGKVIADTHTNTIIVTDIPSQFPVIEATIKELDVRLPMIIIEVEIIETDIDTVDKIGIKWGDYDGNENGNFLEAWGSGRTTMYPFTKQDESKISFGETTSQVGPDGTIEDVYLGFVSASDLGAVLSLLTKDTNSKILARPKILTLSGKEAQIIVGERYPYETTVTTDTGTTSSVEWADIGTTLIVTCWVSPADDSITMYIHPEISTLIESLAIGPRIATKETDSVVRVKDGDTIVIGGLIDSQSEKSTRKIPWLGDIPIIGELFTYRDNSSTDTELIIFLTPRVVHDEERLADLAFKSSSFEWEFGNFEIKDEAMERILDEFED